MDDLVKRLRAIQNDCAQYVNGSDIIRDSADRIESQDREIAELKRRLARWESAPVVAEIIDEAQVMTGLDMLVDGTQLIARPTEET